MNDPKQLLAKITARGHFRVLFRPVQYTRGRIELGRTTEAVRDLRVQFRGWDYPHFPSGNKQENDLTVEDSFAQGVCDWATYKELWRFYTSGQFIHLAAFREDWMEDAYWKVLQHQLDAQGKVFDAIGTLAYVSTEIFEFLSRLMRDGIYEGGVHVNIRLENMSSRRLIVSDADRYGMFDEYRCDGRQIDWAKSVAADEGVGEAAKLAAKYTRYVLQRFKLNDPSREMVEGAIDTLRTGRR